MSVRVNIDGEFHEGRTVAEAVRRVFGPGAIVRREYRSPYYGKVVRRAYHGVYDVLANIRTVTEIPDDDGGAA